MDLKQFIQQHPAAFNSEEPGDQVFAKILDQLPGKKITRKKWNINTFRRVAALICILFAVGTVYWLSVTRKPAANTVPPVVLEETESSDAQYAKQIYHFKELIGLKQHELKQLEKEYPELYRQFMDDIRQLDSSYQTLKNNLAAYPNREMLLEAMLENLRLQSELLNRQLLIIKEIKQKSITHEKVTI